MKVILANKSLGITQGTVSVTGHSRRHLGYSAYSDAWKCHVIELSIGDYEKCIDDLSRNWHKSRGRWVPHFVEGEVVANVVSPENNAALRETAIGWARQLTAADITQIAKEHGLIVTVVPIEMAEQAAAIRSTDDLPTKYFSLCKIAKDEGVDITGLPRKGEAVRAAILAHRQQKAA